VDREPEWCWPPGEAEAEEALPPPPGWPPDPPAEVLVPGPPLPFFFPPRLPRREELPEEEPEAPCWCGGVAPGRGAPEGGPWPPAELDRRAVAGGVLAMVNSSI
jgi:hypothetical protein